jgi:hypothetical protein
LSISEDGDDRGCRYAAQPYRGLNEIYLINEIYG